MNRTKRIFCFFALLLVLLLPGCARESGESLVGKWTTDLGNDQGSMMLDFREDGSYEATFTLNPNLLAVGEYRILAGEVVEVTTQTEDGQPQTVQMGYQIEGVKLTLTQNRSTQVFYRLENEE